jgi:hypothetical protein
VVHGLGTLPGDAGSDAYLIINERPEAALLSKHLGFA